MEVIDKAIQDAYTQGWEDGAQTEYETHVYRKTKLLEDKYTNAILYSKSKGWLE